MGDDEGENKPNEEKKPTTEEIDTGEDKSIIDNVTDTVSDLFK